MPTPANHIHISLSEDDPGEEIKVRQYAPVTTATINVLSLWNGRRVAVVAGNTTPVLHTDWRFGIRVSKTQLETLRPWVGKQVFLQEPYHTDDGLGTPTTDWRCVLFSSLDNETMMNTMGVWFTAEIALTALEPEA